MCVEIRETEHDTILVNGKEVYKDHEGNWIARIPLTAAEDKLLRMHLGSGRKASITIVKEIESLLPPMGRILQEVIAERERQDAKWGQTDYEPYEYLMILGEEVGEANKAALETWFQYEGSDIDYSPYRTELIQVAAVAVKAVEALDRKQYYEIRRYPDSSQKSAISDAIDSLGAIYEQAKDLVVSLGLEAQDHVAGNDLAGQLYDKLQAIRDLAAVAIQNQKS